MGVFERAAGYLLVERAVIAQAAEAEDHGATLHVGETVLGLACPSGGVEVQTDREFYSAGRLIVSAGAWAGTVLAGLQIPLRVLRKAGPGSSRKPMLIDPTGACPLSCSICPCSRTTPDARPLWRGRECEPFSPEVGNCFYGFPQIDAPGVKVAEHSGGTVVEDPLHVDRRLDLADEQRRVTDFCRTCLPQLSGRRSGTSVCCTQ